MDHAKEVAILDAARELMFTKGPAKLSMEAVARKAGVSKVTLYNRFSNKNVLIEVLIRRQSNELIKHLGITPEARISPRQALYKFGQRLLSFILSQDNLNFLRLLGSVPEADRDLLQGIYDYGVQASQLALSQWLSAEHDAGHLNCPDVDFVAEMFLSMIVGHDILRALHQLPPRQPNGEITTHVDKVVKACLHMWAPG
ncbi:hypothetical protein CFI10_14665 [Marinobacterium iners]|uniref:TetR/AcrR family transcriptional regulator n=1 Tax=Marinobacterium iners TaxID=48076 RepID=UPI001A8E67FA|nr:TetR/AcrR family transcriptional regulator [Marinobacterium iners]QSR36209.1 hypothetical protein CFI10_14665 [Marinobacterium iners]